MHETDSPDVNKARGFLIGYSVLVLLLWFFGADLTEFKLLGNEIKMHQNGQHVWFVLGFINVYLWFRFLQRLPDRALMFDGKMHFILDNMLISLCKMTHRRAAYAFVNERLASWSECKNPKLTKLEIFGSLYYRDNLERDKGNGDFAPDGPWSYRYPSRAKVRFSFRTHTMSSKITGGESYEAMPGRLVYSLAILLAFIKGALVHSWFTDNVLPLLVAILTIGAAFDKWWQINVFV
jgi:hypothetical protein